MLWEHSLTIMQEAHHQPHDCWCIQLEVGHRGAMELLPKRYSVCTRHLLLYYCVHVWLRLCLIVCAPELPSVNHCRGAVS